MSVPDHVREKLERKVWAEADQAGWLHLSMGAKSRQYDNWARDQEIGGLIERYIDRRDVRTYLKESLLRRYARERYSDPERPFRVLKISENAKVSELYEKPHGRRLGDGRIVAWGRALDWKSIILAIHERAHEEEGYVPHAAVLFDATGRHAERRTREMIEDASGRLGIEIIWLEM